MRKMKVSKIEYLGEIPMEWNILNLKYLGFTKSGLGNKKPEDFGHGYPFISYKNIYTNFSIDSTYGDLVESTDYDRKFFNVKRGDAFFTGSSETIEELGMASMCLNDIKNATYNGFCIRFRPYSLENYFPEFMMYYFRSYATREHLVRNDNSITRANLSQKLLNMLPVLIPTFNEQKLIASFLDRKVSAINNIIEKTKESIEEYKKLKQSIITEAVTKGLNPDVKMKDSGIEWIGDIPEHWCLKKLKTFVTLQTGKTPSTAIHRYFNGDVKWYKPGDFDVDLTLIDSEDKLASFVFVENIMKLIPANSIYFVGIGATVGKMGVSTEPACCNQQVTALIPQNIEHMYLLYLMQAANNYIKDNALYTTLPIINNSYLGSLKFPIPTNEEQVAIIEQIKTKKNLIEHLINDKLRIISELELYKKSLIYEVVTGKKEVPETEVN